MLWKGPGHRLPTDASRSPAGCVARYTQAEEVKEGGMPEAAEVYCQGELAKNRQGGEARPSRGCKKASYMRVLPETGEFHHSCS
jgi:hypothetical protein